MKRLIASGLSALAPTRQAARSAYRFIIPPKVEYSREDLQVFHDPRGLRKRYFVAMIALSGFGMYVLAATLQPHVTTPVFQSETNGDTSYVSQLAAEGKLDGLVVVGEPGGVLNRVVRIERDGAKMAFADPFSDTVYRQATPDEAERTAGREFAQEVFGAPKDGQLMLTFDDGPDPRYTPALLDLLARENVRATFFVLGSSVVESPEIFERIVREGHQVANHSWSHPDFDTLSDWQRFQEISATQRVMRAINGYDSRVFRIPRGDPDSKPLALMLAQQQGNVHANFNLDTVDWRYPAGATIPTPTLDGGGKVVLMHDSGGDRSQTIAMTERLIAQGKSQGYRFDTMEPLLPDEYLPVRNVTPSVGDYATYWVALATWQLPRNLMQALFWFGMISFPAMTILYVILAFVSRRLQKGQFQDWFYRDIPVSIVVPCYNEGTIPDPTDPGKIVPLSEAVACHTLASLLRTRHRNYEILAVDDGSTDDTMAALLWFKANHYPGLRIVGKRNSGKSGALNRGIDLASHDVVVILDGDTQFEPGTITKLARHFTDPFVGAVAGVVKVGNRTRNLLVRWQALEYLIGALTREAQSLLGGVMVISGACAAVRRSAIKEVGGFNSRTRAEDADATIAMQLAGWRVVQDVEAVAYTEVPIDAKQFRLQRRRWTLGTVQALWRHKSAIFRRSTSWGMRFVLTYTYISLLLPLLFNPLVFIFAGALIWSGNWQPVVIFAVMVAVVQLFMGVCAIRLTRERYRLLWTMPFYRPVFELLMAYLLLYVLRVIVAGNQTAWGKPKRTNDVQRTVTA